MENNDDEDAICLYCKDENHTFLKSSEGWVGSASFVDLGLTMLVLVWMMISPKKFIFVFILIGNN